MSKFSVVEYRNGTHVMGWEGLTHGSMDDAIEKWQFLANLPEDATQYLSGYNSESCTLCWAYLSETCCDCPIKLFTKEAGCRSTPYADFNRSVLSRSGSARKYAINMVKLLKEIKLDMEQNPENYAEGLDDDCFDGEDDDPGEIIVIENDEEDDDCCDDDYYDEDDDYYF